MRTILIWAAALAVGSLAWGMELGSPPAKKTAPRKKSAASSTPAKAPAHTAASKPAGATASVHRGSKKGPVSRTTWRNRQAAPTPARYQEIQSALAAKGYLAPEAVGTWGQASVDALKRFQAEQNLESSGKINSLSLIALGLGPKYDTPAKALDVNPGQFDR